MEEEAIETRLLEVLHLHIDPVLAVGHNPSSFVRFVTRGALIVLPLLLLRLRLPSSAWPVFVAIVAVVAYAETGSPSIVDTDSVQLLLLGLTASVVAAGCPHKTACPEKQS